MQRIILHIDVNSAYLSWSALKLLKNGYKKDIRNEVAVIAGDPTKRHGVIVAASIPAKKLGISPPINLYEARKICKDLIIVKPDMAYYKDCSNKLITFLKELFPVVEQFSIDECFVDYTGLHSLYGNEVEFAHKLKDDIYKKFGFTVNIGIGNNKLCAKMASDFEKPNKVHTLYMQEFKEKMWPKDISELFMAGKSSCNKLRESGINTIGQLANFDVNILISKLKSHGKLLYNYANGIDESAVNTENYDERKSISFSRTLASSSDDKTLIFSYLKEFSRDIEKKMMEKGVYANTVVVTIRFDNFKTISHQKKLLNSIYNKEDIFENAKNLFDKLWDGEKIRLIGLGTTDFSDSNIYQLSFFDKQTKPNKGNDTDELITKLNKELGDNIIMRGNKL